MGSQSPPSLPDQALELILLCCLPLWLSPQPCSTPPPPHPASSFLATARFQPKLWVWPGGPCLVVFVSGRASLGLAQLLCSRRPCFLQHWPSGNKEGLRGSAFSTSSLRPYSQRVICSLPLTHSVAGYPKPQHPGDGAQCCALPAGQPRILSYPEPGKERWAGGLGGFLCGSSALP